MTRKPISVPGGGNFAAWWPAYFPVKASVLQPWKTREDLLPMPKGNARMVGFMARRIWGAGPRKARGRSRSNFLLYRLLNVMFIEFVHSMHIGKVGKRPVIGRGAAGGIR